MIADAGSLPAYAVTSTLLQRAYNSWAKYAHHTRTNYTRTLLRFIRCLEEDHGARPGLARCIPRPSQPDPRTVIATPEERRQLLAAATPALRFFLLLCADLGIRHATAARMKPIHYNREARTLSFYTKANVHQTLPVTPEIAAIIEGLPGEHNPTAPIANILRPNRSCGEKPRFTKQWKALKKKVGVRADLRIHDLRRTMAEETYAATGDIRAVQAQLGHRSPVTTARYLANRIALPELRVILERVAELRAKQALEGNFDA